MTMIWIAVAVLSLLGLAFGLILGYASRRFKVEEDPIVDKIDDILPQSQCGQCGFRAAARMRICCQWRRNKPLRPGGEQVMLKLADMLGVDPQPLDGDESVLNPVRKVAFIHEDQCIGCTKCIQACPVDAIIGATRAMHTVVEDLCTGCDLCVAPCPTDCIEMIPSPSPRVTGSGI